MTKQKANKEDSINRRPVVISNLFKFSTLSLLFVSLISHAQTASSSPAPETEDELQTKVVEFEGYLRADNDFNPNGNGNLKYNLRTQKFELQANLRLPKLLPEWVAKQLLLVVRSQMEQDIFVNGILNANHLTVQDYLKEAYIEFRKVGGLPIAVIMGTSEVAYGQDYPGMMDYQSDASHGMTDPDRGQVKGFTVAIDKIFLPLFDKVEANFFAPNPQFISGGLTHFDGFAFRVTKKLSENFLFETSILHKGNSYDPGLKPETEVSFGGVYRKGIWSFWGEGIKMNRSEKYPNAPYGVTFGTSRITGPGQINVEATGIKNTLQQYAMGYQLFLNQQWAIGSAFRYTFCAGGNNGCVGVRGYGQGPSLGVSARYTFGGGAEYKNSTWIRKKTRFMMKKINVSGFREGRIID